MVRYGIIVGTALVAVFAMLQTASAVNPKPAQVYNRPPQPQVRTVYVEKECDHYKHERRYPSPKYSHYPSYDYRRYPRGDYYRRYPVRGTPIIYNAFPMPYLAHDEAATRAACQARLRQLREDVKKNLYEKGTPEQQYKQKIGEKKFEWESTGEAGYLRSIGVTDREEREGWRVWQTRGGLLTVKAQYLGIQYGHVHLQKENGSRLQLNIRELSDEDLTWLAENKVSRAMLAKYLE